MSPETEKLIAAYNAKRTGGESAGHYDVVVGLTHEQRRLVERALVFYCEALRQLEIMPGGARPLFVEWDLPLVEAWLDTTGDEDRQREDDHNEMRDDALEAIRVLLGGD
jgi:hypothetical protein